MQKTRPTWSTCPQIRGATPEMARKISQIRPSAFPATACGTSPQPVRKPVRTAAEENCNHTKSPFRPPFPKGEIGLRMGTNNNQSRVPCPKSTTKTQDGDTSNHRFRLCLRAGTCPRVAWVCVRNAQADAQAGAQAGRLPQAYCGLDKRRRIVYTYR